TVLTLAQYIANPEMYEGSLIGFVGLSLVGGTWPASGSANLSLSDGVDTVVFRIDSDTDIDGQTEPSWPVDVIGIGSQYDNSAPYDGGYQIFPRYYATDFLPAGTIPVELTSFTAKVSGNVVNLSWSTATETNNLGFEIQCKTSDQFITVGFVDGHGTSTEIHNYSYTDSKVESGKYYYRLKQIDLDGTYEYSKVVEAEVLKPVKFALDQNYPNPFNPTTMINVNLATDSRVKLVVFDILGQEVATLLNGNLTAGLHQIEFNASNLNSGVYFYRVDATGVDGTNFSSVKKMILTK
ncbi:MAG: T9SS type A sorting domain-containing protein, partial [Ignavibacteriaceae bacterium]